MGILQRDVDDVLAKVRTWKPERFEKEVEYERALYAFLNKAFPKEVFATQYSMANTRADLFVHFQGGGAKVAIEVKANVTDRGEYHRLLGQVWTYVSEWDCEALVVMCGNNDPALAKHAARFVEFVNEHHPKKVRFIEVTD